MDGGRRDGGRREEGWRKEGWRREEGGRRSDGPHGVLEADQVHQAKLLLRSLSRKETMEALICRCRFNQASADANANFGSPNPAPEEALLSDAARLFLSDGQENLHLRLPRPSRS